MTKQQITLDNIAASIEELKADVTGMKTDIADIKTDIAHVKQDIKYMGQRMTTMSDHIQTLTTKQDLSDVKDEIIKTLVEDNNQMTDRVVKQIYARRDNGQYYNQ